MSSLSALCTKLAACLRVLHSCGQHLGQGAGIWYTVPSKGPWGSSSPHEGACSHGTAALQHIWAFNSRYWHIEIGVYCILQSTRDACIEETK